MPHFLIEQVAWSSAFASYAPVHFTSAGVLRQPAWADAPNPWLVFNWNKLTAVDRRSWHGAYAVAHGVPRNPAGRTGLAGRGRLGRWGPNHAADPVVSRWKRDDAGRRVRHAGSGQFILQFVAIQRADTREWAIPGVSAFLLFKSR